MLNEKVINALPEPICVRLDKINSDFLQLIGEKIREIGELRPTDVHRLQQLYMNGAPAQEIAEKLARVSQKNIAEIYEMFDIVAKDEYSYAEPFYEAVGRAYPSYEQNEALTRYVKAQAEQSAETYRNLTQNTAFCVFDEQGNIPSFFAENAKKVPTSLSQTYTKVLDMAVQRASLGLSDYQSEMRGALKALADSGIRTVDYSTGYSRRVDSAVRQNLLWGLKQTNQGVADLTGEQFGADGYEIDYHSCPRPSHADMGGRQYAKGTEPVTIDGVTYPPFSPQIESLLQDYGCLHFKFSIILGVSSPAYSPEQLAQFKERDNRGIEYEGETYTPYEATQVQRKLETQIRRHKDRAVIAAAAGDDDLRREEQEKINTLTRHYTKFSKEAQLSNYPERMSVSGFHNVKTKAELKGTNKIEVNKHLTERKKSDIIKESKDVSGARNPNGKAASKHAVTYYDFVRKTDSDISKIAENTGIDRETIRKIKQFLFLDEHDLSDGKARFKPDYDIAQSWQRLIDGKHIYKHDITLLKHEEYEEQLIASGKTQEEAHIIASYKFNYSKEVDDFNAGIKKYKKE